MGRFKIGDKVRVREWDDMLKEFGGNDNAIICACIFLDDMKPLCGKVFTVTEAKNKFFYSLDGEARGWKFSDDALYPAITYREYMQENYPEDVEDSFFGGVFGCPHDKGDFFDFSKTGQCGFSCVRCKECWDQYITEAEYKKYVLKEEGEKGMDYKVGDIVKVVKAERSEYTAWVPEMNEYVGRAGVVKWLKEDSCQIEGLGGWCFPYKDLEPASPKELLTPLCSVKVRNGNVYIFDGKNRFVREGRYLSMCDHNKNLNDLSNSDFDVMDICAPSDHVTELSEFLTKRGECIWKREGVVEISVEEAAEKLSEQYPGQTVKIIV